MLLVLQYTQCRIRCRGTAMPCPYARLDVKFKTHYMRLLFLHRKYICYYYYNMRGGLFEYAL
jgi:hypothetical protein